jgi:hypothetical protein
MPLELFEDAKGDPRNAHTLAIASDLAYNAEAPGAPLYREQLGVEARLISVGNTQVYVLTNDEHIIAAFRGTEAPTSIDGLKDWLLTDAANLLIVPEGRLGTDLIAAGVGARFHQGFVKALGDVWEPLFEMVDAERKKNDRPLWLTGHSLGGALALLAGWMFTRKFVSVHQIYTFGGPMIGNAAAIAAFDRELEGKVYRYVNSPDPVPMLPTFSLIANHYAHCQKEMVLGTAVGETVGSAIDTFKQLAGKAVDGVMHATLIDDVWKAVTQRVDAHLMENYRNLITALFKKE